MCATYSVDYLLLLTRGNSEWMNGDCVRVGLIGGFQAWAH